jgi:uncharacterized protein (DUF2132 family)
LNIAFSFTHPIMQHRILTLPEETGGLQGQKPTTTLSFKPFLDYVRMRLQDADSIKKDIYELILEKFSHYPELEQSIQVEDTAKYKPLLNLLYVVLSTVVEDEKKILWGLCVPVTPVIFYGSDSIYDLLLTEDTQTINPDLFCAEETNLRQQKCEMLYSYLLEYFYDFSFSKKNEMIRSVFDKTSGLKKYYRVNLDTRFVTITTTEPLPALNLETLEVHLHEEAGLEVLERVLPLQNFHFSGFSIITITDVTTEYATDQIRELLVNGNGKAGEETFDIVSSSLKAIGGSNTLEFSLLPIFRVNDKLVEDIDAYCHSIIFSLGKQQGIMKNYFIPLIEKFVSSPRLIYFRDLDETIPAQQEKTKLLQLAGLKSYALLPVHYNNKLVGAFEIYSKQKGILDEKTFSRIEPAMPLIAQLMQNSVDEFDKKITDTIRHKFTSLQPSVQWKFNEAAWDYLYQSRMEGKPALLQKIEFKNVYPLYGAIDMRNSTNERNNALLNDLQYQFRKLQEVLTAVKNGIALGLADDFIFKTSKWQQYLVDTLSTNDEIRINQFLNDEAHPFLEHFKKSTPALEPAITAYFESIDQATGNAWKHRRELEESMQLINNAVNNYLDLMNTEIQQAFPCYFEKFRTDGVEYDVYIGQSIAPEKTFDLVYLKNLRLWQLSSMASIAKLSHLLLPQLKVPLQTTQLIFIYSNTIDISFRNDERRFDVEGGYNIRYHIIKKRIDKVHIKHSGERLTQPGKIALIYFDQKDANEYISYIHHLQDKKLLLDDMEQLELEELQGVAGLKALRVGVALDNSFDIDM